MAGIAAMITAIVGALTFYYAAYLPAQKLQQPPALPLKTCPTESSTLLPYVNATIGIKMLYPSDWKRVIDVQNNAVRFFSPSHTGNVHVSSALEKQIGL